MMEKLNKGFLYKDFENINIDLESIPLNEYPRPNFKRDFYQLLNGKRDYKISKEKDIPKTYDGTIIVPYAVESPLSNVNHLLEPDEYIYYHKTLKLDKKLFKSHIFLNFDGVDQICDVYVNNNFLGTHIGGYTKFKFDIRPYVDESLNVEIILRVKDVTDSSYYMRGKQRLEPSGWFYSSSSGIYKPVWIEAVDEDYISDLTFIPLYDEKAIKVLIKSNTNGIADLKIIDKIYKIETNKETIIKLDEFHPWNIDDPYLYDVIIVYKNDVVTSYFGMRKIEVKKEKNNTGIYLNNKKIIINGLLDQGYYYLGGLTPQNYRDYETDVLNMKKLGFNCLRKHIKVELDMFYYYCDKYGLLVIQDFPCGGTSYKFLNVVIPRISIKLFNKERFCTYKKYGRLDKEGRDQFEKEIKEIMNDLSNYPSIIMYTIFNEAWGQFDASRIYKELKEIDNYHLFDTASGWLDTGKNSDIFSIHSYTLPSLKRKDKKNHRPYVLTEIGGISLKINEHYHYPKLYGHGKCKSKEQLEKKYKKLFKSLIKRMKDKEGLNGIIYTELNDCETECNGIYTLDRKILKIDENIIKQLNEEIKNIN